MTCAKHGKLKPHNIHAIWTDGVPVYICLVCLVNFLENRIGLLTIDSEDAP